MLLFLGITTTTLYNVLLIICQSCVYSLFHCPQMARKVSYNNFALCVYIILSTVCINVVEYGEQLRFVLGNLDDMIAIIFVIYYVTFLDFN